MKLIQYIGYLSIFIISSCAQQVSPTGGGKDTEAPKIIGSKPKNKTTNFFEDKITLKFDEYVQIKDPNQIIISPLLEDKPQIDAIGKSIEIVFGKSKPAKNTTYTINFGNSIQDVNESNILSNYSYVFATGNVLDSNKIEGEIKNAFTKKPEANIVIGLYKTINFQDTLLHKIFPSYFGKSNDSGEFAIENLPNDSFFIICFKDQNADNKYQKNEDVAFGSDIINTSSTNNKINLNLFTPDSHKPNTILDSLSKQKGKYQFSVYKREDIIIRPEMNVDFYTNYTKGKNLIDTIDIYVPSFIDSLQAKFIIKTTDTVFATHIKTKAKSKIPAFNVNIEEPLKPGDSIYITTTLPIKDIQINNIELLEDTNKINNIYSKQLSPFKLVLHYPFKESQSYQITLKDSVITDVFGNKNKKITTTFIAKSTKDFGNLFLNISSINNKDLILQLVEDNIDENIVEQIYSPFPNIVQINNLKAANYRIKLIEDRNKNRKWDNGHFKKRLQPEPIFYKKEVITIKAYWDIEQSINIENIINN
jgi:hypothetical protein